LTRQGQGRYIAAFINAKQNQNAIEIMGVDVGLEIIEMERAPGENGGAFRLKLSTPEAEPEAKMPRTFYDGTSYSSSLGLILALAKLPTITTLSVTAAAAAGGTAVTVTGTNFWGGGVNSAVLRVEWINQATGASVNQVTYTVASDTSITLNTPAMAAGLYKLKITTLRGNVFSGQNMVVS
jgi:hypothetical protein